MSGDVAPLILRAHRVIAEHYSETSIAQLILTGQIDRVIQQAFSDAILNAAYAPVRERMRSGVIDAIKFVAKNDVPRRTGRIEFAFDSLSPDVLDGIQQLETKVITTLKDDVRETVRQHIRAGIEEGVNPRTSARNLREVIGLAPNQEEAVRNFRRALEGAEGARSPLAYKLRDKRFDGTLRKGELTAEQVEKMTAAYRKRMVAFNAETNARTAALDAQKLGQKLSWQQAADQGIVDATKLKKRWVGIKDSRERPEHLAMEGETVRFDDTYSNGEEIPGDSTYNCRCVSVVFESRSAA